MLGRVQCSASPQATGRIRDHQDFGYTYTQGMLNPQKILQLLIPMDPNRLENGCVQALRGSHALGRLQHADGGDGQLAAEASRVAAAEQFFPRVALEMDPGDVCFTHSCLIHGSEPNASMQPRWNMVLGFNAKSNEPNSAIIADNYGTAGTSGRQGGEASVSIKPSYNKIETVSSGKPTCLIDQICILYTFVICIYFILHGSNASTHLWTMRAELIYRPV